MANIKELVAGIEVELEAAEKRHARALAAQKLILDTCNQDGRSTFTEEESSEFDQHDENIQLAKSQQVGIKSRLARAKKVEAEELDAEQRSLESRPTAAARAPGRTAEVHVGNEERTYTKEKDPRGTLFLRDICRNYMYQDVQASSRLSRHMAEERIENAAYLERAAGDTLTANWAGLTVPQYLTDMVAPAVANLRPFADIANKHPLPADGMSVNISRVTTAASASLQATELTESSATSLDDTLLTIPVQTASGEQLVSRQAIDRGTGIEDTVLQDLFSRYYSVLDSTLINQAATGLSAIATVVAYTDATPTGAELYPKFMAASAGVEAALLAMGMPSHVIMHSRRWYWLASQMTASWPLINSQGIPVQAGGTLTPSGYNSGVRGVLPNGLLVVVDNNVPTGLGAGTNEDEAYVVPAREVHLWEDPSAPAFIRAEQPSAGKLGVQLVVYGYFAYTMGRYANGMQKIGGTGLVTPVF